MSGGIVNFVFLQVVWFACVLGSAEGVPWAGPLVAAVGLTWHFSRAAVPGEGRTVVCVAGAGAVLETASRLAGLVEPASTLTPAPFAPLWLVSLWAVFATTPYHSMSWLRGRYLTAALLGAVFGPAGFLGAERMGALTTHAGSATFWAATAPGWALMMPLLLWLREREQEADAIGRPAVKVHVEVPRP